MTVVDNVITRLRRGLVGFTGDEPLLAAAVAAAALVITADDNIAHEEVETAVADLQTEPTLGSRYLPEMLEDELQLAIERTRTHSGSASNRAMVSAVKDRPIDQRNNILLIAIDVAMAHNGISEVENRTISDLAGRLAVDRASLEETVEAQRFLTGSGLDLHASESRGRRCEP